MVIAANQPVMTIIHPLVLTCFLQSAFLLTSTVSLPWCLYITLCFRSNINYGERCGMGNESIIKCGYGYFHIPMVPHTPTNTKERNRKKRETLTLKNKVSPSPVVAIPSAYQYKNNIPSQRGHALHFDGFDFHRPASCGVTEHHLSIVPARGYTSYSFQPESGKKGE